MYRFPPTAFLVFYQISYFSALEILKRNINVNHYAADIVGYLYHIIWSFYTAIMEI